MRFSWASLFSFRPVLSGRTGAPRPQNALAVVTVSSSATRDYNEIETTGCGRARYGGALTADMLKQMDLKKRLRHPDQPQIVVAKAKD